MSSKTKVCAVLAAACLVGGSASAQSAKVIPYPADIDITAEGASSAPAEINHADSVYFPLLNFYEMESTDTLTILHHYPTYQQTKEHTCGPAAALTVLYWYGNHDYDEIQLAKEMKTQGYPIGTNPRNMVRFFERIGWQVESTLKAAPISHFNDFHALVQKNLAAGRPIMVENVEWGGHWRVIIGYDDMGTASTLDDTLILADSYDTSDHQQDGYVLQNAERFFSMWFDHFMLPKNQRHQPFIIAHP